MADDRDRPPGQQTGAAPDTPAPAETGTGTATDPGRTGYRHASPMPPPATDAGPRTSFLTTARRRATGIVATVISVITTVVVVTLAVHIVFVAFEANASNDLVSTISGWAEGMAWQFKDVFQPEDPKIGVAVNYGLAALVYLVAGRIVVGLIRRLD